jgi:SpoVK/Ycf46/Vps4 family AAA+-type ATPase
MLELEAAVQQHNKSCELLLYLAPQQAQHLGVRSNSLVHVRCASAALEGLARVKVDLKLSHDTHSILKCPTLSSHDQYSKLSKVIQLHIALVDERSIQQWDCLEVLPSESTSAAEALTIARPQALHSFLLGSVVRDGAPTLVQPAMVRTVGGGRRQQQHSSTDQSDELQLNSWGVVTASTVIVGPDAAFSVRFYDREAHLAVPAATEAVLRCHPVPLVQGVASRILRACSSSTTSSNTRAAVLPLLLHGPPGVGKSLLIEVLARALRCRLVVVSAGRLAAAAGVDSDAALQRALTYCSACSAERTVLLLDSADKLFPAAEGRVGRSLGDSDVALLNRLVLAAAAAGSRSSATTAAAATAAATDAVTDASTAAAAAGVVVQSQSSSGAVVIIGVTSALSCLNPTARRCFTEEVEVLPPSDALRAVVLRAAVAQTLPQAAQQQLSLSSKPDTPENSNFAATGDAVVRIAQAAQGFSAADLHAVASAAAALLQQQQQQQVTAAHAHSAGSAPQQPAQLLTAEQALWRALHSIKPAVALARGSSSSSSSSDSSAAAAAAAVPAVQWADVGGLHRAKAALQEMVVWPQTRPEAFARLGITPAAGVLLYGPPGTGKTLLAKGECSLFKCLNCGIQQVITLVSASCITQRAQRRQALQRFS